MSVQCAGRGLKGPCPAGPQLPKEGLCPGGGEPGVGQDQLRGFITTGWDPRSVEEVTTLFRPAIFFPSAGLFGFLPRLYFHNSPSWLAGCGHGSTTHPAAGVAQPWASCPSLGRLIGGKQPSSLLQNRKLLSLLPEGQELSPWQPWDKEATLTLPRAGLAENLFLPTPRGCGTAQVMRGLASTTSSKSYHHPS